MIIPAGTSPDREALANRTRPGRAGGAHRATRDGNATVTSAIRHPSPVGGASLGRPPTLGRGAPDTTTGTRPGAPGGGCRLPRPTPAQPGQIRPGTIPGGLRRFPPGITDHFPSLVRRLTEGWRFPCLRRVSQYRSGVVAAAGW